MTIPHIDNAAANAPSLHQKQVQWWQKQNSDLITGNTNNILSLSCLNQRILWLLFLTKVISNKYF